MTLSVHRLLAGGALAAGAVTLGFAAGGIAAVDGDLAAATRPAPAVRDVLIEHRAVPEFECPAHRDRTRLGEEL